MHRVHSGPKTKKWPQNGGGPVGFSFNARQTKNGFEYPFWLHFSTRYHSFSSPWATRPNGSRQPSKRFASTPILMTKNREWHALSQTKKYWTNNKTKQIWTNFSQLSHKELIFRNSWPVRNGIKNLILSLFCNNFYGILNPPKKFFLESHLKKFPSGQLFFHDFLKFPQVCGIFEPPHCTAPIAVLDQVKSVTLNPTWS